MRFLAQRTSELRLAIMLLTRLPVGRLPEPAPSLSDANWAFPLVGLIVGLIAGLTHSVLMSIDANATLAAILVLGAMVLSTGALHQDGLADFADGIWGGQTKARRLDIMRDSQIGSYGVMALILCCALWVACVSQLANSINLASFLAIGLLSRIAMTFCLTRLPSAREDGLGAAVGKRKTLPVLAIFLIPVAFLLPGAGGLAVVIVVGLVTVIVAQIALRRIGGQTGDVLGAVQFLTETAAWTTLAIATG